MDGGEPEFPRSQRRGADFMDGDHRGAHRTRTDGRGREEMAVGDHFRDRPCRGAIRRRHVPAERISASSPPVSASRSTRCSGWACWCASRRNRSSTSSHAAGPRSYCSSQSNSSRLPWCCSAVCSRPWRDVKNGRRRGTGNIGRRFWSGRRVRCSLGVFRPRIESAPVLGRQHRAAI